MSRAEPVADPNSVDRALPFFDRLDRYLIRLFWSSYGVAFVFFFGAFMVVDLFSKADSFLDTGQVLGLESHELLGDVARYYLYGAPAVFLQVAPFVTVIGCIVTLTRLMQNNELVPVLMSGRSVFRMLRPIFGCALILTVAMILVQELVSPRAGNRRLALGSFLEDGRSWVDLSHVMMDRQGNQWLSVRFDLEQRTILRAQVVRRSQEDDEFAIAEVENLEYDRRQNPSGWRSREPFVWKVNRGDSTQMEAESAEFIVSSLDPEQVGANLKDAFDLSFRDLGLLIATTANERNKPRYLVLLHYHITFPLTNILLILLVLPFVVRYERGRLLLGLAAAFLLCGVYFGVDFALRSLGEERLHPVLAAWFTPIFFGSLGISLFDGIRS